MNDTQYDPLVHRVGPPTDEDAPYRVVRLKELGIGDAPVPEFDDFARRLAEVTGAPYAMVNFIDEHRQYFSGLYTPAVQQSVDLGTAGPETPQVGRVMARDHGYCPYVAARRKALPLEDVLDYPRFAGNPVIDKLNIRTYLGAPLMDHTGIALGTICVVDVEPRPWRSEGLNTIKTMAAELVDQIHQRERRA